MTTVCHVLCITWLLSIKLLINPLRIVTVTNKINLLNSEKRFNCGGRLKAERVLFWFVHNSFLNSLIDKSSLWCPHNSTKESHDTRSIVCTGLDKNK